MVRKLFSSQKQVRGISGTDIVLRSIVRTTGETLTKDELEVE